MKRTDAARKAPVTRVALQASGGPPPRVTRSRPYSAQVSAGLAPVCEVFAVIRHSEVVLPGHPDKFCALAADAIGGRLLPRRLEPNPCAADRYVVDDAVCQRREDPRRWTDHVNDQWRM